MIRYNTRTTQEVRLYDEDNGMDRNLSAGTPVLVSSARTPGRFRISHTDSLSNTFSDDRFTAAQLPKLVEDTPESLESDPRVAELLENIEASLHHLNETDPTGDGLSEFLTEARHLLGHYGYAGGWQPGGFTTSLIRAWEKADGGNRRRLRMGFPALGLAVGLLGVDRGVEALQVFIGNHPR